MIQKDTFQKENEISEEIKQLVVIRIEVQMSPNLRLSIGGEGSLDANQMIAHVKKGDEIGRQIVQSHLNFIKAQANGQLINALTSVE